MKEEGTILLKLEGVSLEDTDRYRQAIHTLIAQGVLGLRRGSVTLHFDHEGVIQEIEYHRRWRRTSSPERLVKFYERVTVDKTN